MQINRTGYLLLAVFGLGGVLILAFGLAFSEAAFVAIPLGGIWLLTTAGLGVYAIRSAQRGRHEQDLFKTGLRGKATLVSVRSGVMINDQPRMTLELDLEIPGQESRRLIHKTLVSNFAAHRFEPGLVLPVCVNPQDPNDILVVW